jgi:DNA-binding response OmpR family regulator
LPAEPSNWWIQSYSKKGRDGVSNKSSTPTQTGLTAILLTDGPHTMDMLSAVTSGFGMTKRLKARTVEEAFDYHKVNSIDLIILDCSTAEINGIEITRRFRVEFEGERSETPILAVAGHASQVQIGKYRDAGASFVVAKPVAPGILLQRILWLAKDTRDLVNTPTFRGPDRRVRATGLPAGITQGRRATDLDATVSEIAGLNLDQSRIDNMLKPVRVNLI